MRGEAKPPMFLCESISFLTVKKELKKEFLKKFKKSIDKIKLFCYNIDCSARWCGSMAEQLICNQQVDGSTPFTSSSLYGGIPERPKGADCKSVVTDFAGPNPASPTITRNRPLRSVFCYGVRSWDGNSAAKPTLCRIPQAESTLEEKSYRGILRNAEQLASL